MRPLIGITAEEGAFKRGMQSRVHSGYGHAIQKCGGSPVLLQIMHAPEEHAAVMAFRLHSNCLQLQKIKASDLFWGTLFE